MEINSYWGGIPTVCRACLTLIESDSQIIYLNSPSRNVNLTTIWQKSPLTLTGTDFNAPLCRNCYNAVNVFRDNKESINNTNNKSMLGETLEDNENELLTYKILSDILKEEHVPDQTYIKLNAVQCKTLINTNNSHYGFPNEKISSDKHEFTAAYNHTNTHARYNKSDKSHFNNKLTCKCVNTCGFGACGNSKLMIRVEAYAEEESRKIFRPSVYDEKTSYKCEKCTCQISRRRTPSSNKSYRCTECDFKCSSKSYLNVHMRIHTGEAPYKCHLCGYSTGFKYSLSVHMRTHTGEKPYRCTECEFRCSTKGYLETHMRIHTGETPYRCNVCGYNATFKYTLTVHMRTHLGNKPYECRECKFKCSSESYLKKHIKSHSGEIYTCSVCPYTAASRNTVMQHIKTHTAEKPYKCVKCDYRTRKKYDLRKHMKTHTENSFSTPPNAFLSFK